MTFAQILLLINIVCFGSAIIQENVAQIALSCFLVFYFLYLVVKESK